LVTNKDNQETFEVTHYYIKGWHDKQTPLE